MSWKNDNLMILGETRMHIYASGYLPIARISMNNNHSDPPQFRPNIRHFQHNPSLNHYI